MDERGTWERKASRLCVPVVTACIGACSSASPAATCTFLGQEIMKASAENAVTIPFQSFVGIAGVTDEEFARRRQEYAACATPIRAAVKEQLFSTEHVRAVEQAARTQPDVMTLDRQLRDENASSWQQLDAATLLIATRCGQDPASFVRIYEHADRWHNLEFPLRVVRAADNHIVETNPSFATIMTSHDVRFNHLGPPTIWSRRRDLENGFYPVRNCVSYRPTEPCVTYSDPDPHSYELWFDDLPSLDEATNETQLVCRFSFVGSGLASSDGSYGDGSVHGKGTLNLTTRRAQFIPDRVAVSPQERQEPQEQTNRPARVGANGTAPKQTKHVRPVYPRIARSARVQGVLDAVIGPDGRVQNANVLRSIPLLDQAAVDAVRQWVYAPTLVDGVAVSVIMTVRVSFTLP